MPTGDQLTRRERVRLESLAMALCMPAATEAVITDPALASDALTEVILRRAEQVEKWLLAADKTGH